MTFKVIAQFVDVMGVLHKKGDTIELCELGEKKYACFIAPVTKGAKKNVKRKSSSDSKTKSATDE